MLVPDADLGDVSISYETRGQAGSPVLLLMGLTMPGRVWRFQIPDLAARHRICWYDHRGVGDSDVPEPPYSMSQLAADAVGLLDHLEWADAHVVGVSMGGMIAQHVALEHRSRVRSLSLIATSPGGFWGRIPTLGGLGELLWGTVGGREARRRSMSRLLFPPEFRKRAERRWIEDVLDHDFATPPPRAGRRGQLAAVLGHDARDRIHTLEGLPTLVIQPARDRLVRPSQCGRLHRMIPGARLLTVPDAGHGVIRQSAEIVNEALLRHFADSDDSLGSR